MIPIIAQYCMECKEWIEDSDTHKCSKDSWVLADKEMVGIADRLYSMGIVPTTAMWVATELGTAKDHEYFLTLEINLRRRINESVLDKLPEGWKFHWETVTPDQSPVKMLAYTGRWINVGLKSLDERIAELIQEFEEFLDSKDSEAIKAVLLLMP
jgi:hypothetical protein